jgi:YfiH family protein
MTRPVRLQSGLLAAVAGVEHGFFTRHGGVSEGLYDSLNVGLGSGDAVGAVVENRRRAAAALGAGEHALATCYQIHSAVVRVSEQPWARQRPQGDGVVTRRPGIVCGALAADCAPVLIADGEARVVAAVHAGWRGALAGVIEAAITAMARMGARPEAMVAAVGPCIGPASYEVGLDFLQAFTAADAGHEAFFSAGEHRDKRLFDLPGFVLARLAGAGVGASEWLGRDTCAEPADFFSNRRAVKRGEHDYGRLLSAIVLDGEA